MKDAISPLAGEIVKLGELASLAELERGSTQRRGSAFSNSGRPGVEPLSPSLPRKAGKSQVSKRIALAIGVAVDSEGFAINLEAPMVFHEAFADVPDPRDYNAQHELLDVLFVALAAVLCGATQCTGDGVLC